MHNYYLVEAPLVTDGNYIKHTPAYYVYFKGEVIGIIEKCKLPVISYWFYSERGLIPSQNYALGNLMHREAQRYLTTCQLLANDKEWRFVEFVVPKSPITHITPDRHNNYYLVEFSYVTEVSEDVYKEMYYVYYKGDMIGITQNTSGTQVLCWHPTEDWFLRPPSFTVTDVRWDGLSRLLPACKFLSGNNAFGRVIRVCPSYTLTHVSTPASK